jgi:hypothetical protein
MLQGLSLTRLFQLDKGLIPSLFETFWFISVCMTLHQWTLS